jgi:hypothetical protein
MSTMEDGLLQSDATGPCAARQPDPEQRSVAQIDCLFKSEAVALPFLEPALRAADKLLAPVIVVSVGERGRLVHLGVRVHQLGSGSQRRPAIHLAQRPEIFLGHQTEYRPRLEAITLRRGAGDCRGRGGALAHGRAEVPLIAQSGSGRLAEIDQPGVVPVS